MALLQMRCSYKHYIMSLNHSKHNTLKMKLGGKKNVREKEQDTHTSAPSKLKRAFRGGRHRQLQGISMFNMAFDQEVRDKKVISYVSMGRENILQPTNLLPVHHRRIRQDS